MSKIYCQNNLCPYWKKNRILKNYGKCTKSEVFMTWQTDDEYEVTGHNCECLNSKQDRCYEGCEND